MYTDWLLIRRLAWELNGRFAGAKVRDVGQLEDGRCALALWTKGSTVLLCIDIFAATPVVTIEERDLPIAVESGFIRAAGAALRGTTVLAVRSRTNDRLLRIDLGTRSRFGVEDGYSLVCELVPRFGNIILLKASRGGDGTVVSAAKEFSASENAVRAIEAGGLYEPPPLRSGNLTPLVTEADAERLAQPGGIEGELYVYRREGALVQAHLAPVEKYAGLECSLASSLVELLAESRAGSAQRDTSDRVAKRRRDLARELDKRERKLQNELAQVESALRKSGERETLREQGEAIYATLHDLAPDARDDAKERATELFAAYKKAAASVPHLERRKNELENQLEEAQTLRWELERADDSELDDVTHAVMGSTPVQRKGTAAARKRKPLTVTTQSGSRIFVGRTPIENAELTFRVARPNDLWFHVQKQPGAHVILQRDDAQAAPEDDILLAASYAAYHSKGRNSPKVTVDYTQRKHVRKRPAAAPGLVFYTHPKSVLVSPAEPAAPDAN
ncbi:MAG TPA: NFACT RNA binding domain-containing protein [Candidatus Baltobacteraceae bacterium]|nr:NFACT RNA binding domain-containing protein [Candidatus Baltobacteraceae bacterium]